MAQGVQTSSVRSGSAAGGVEPPKARTKGAPKPRAYSPQLRGPYPPGSAMVASPSSLRPGRSEVRRIVRRGVRIVGVGPVVDFGLVDFGLVDFGLVDFGLVGLRASTPAPAARQRRSDVVGVAHVAAQVHDGVAARLV